MTRRALCCSMLAPVWMFACGGDDNAAAPLLPDGGIADASPVDGADAALGVDVADAYVDAGFDAISVSNHGGNNLDGTPASIRALPTVVAAVGDQVEVLLDGGVRRGSDVVKALALGARAVMIGRAYLWGLAANGQAGVENVLDILRGGIDSGLLGIGKAAVRDLTPDDLLIPDGFVRRLGVEQPASS